MARSHFQRWGPPAVGRGAPWRQVLSLPSGQPSRRAPVPHQSKPFLSMSPVYILGFDEGSIAQLSGQEAKVSSCWACCAPWRLLLSSRVVRLLSLQLLKCKALVIISFEEQDESDHGDRPHFQHLEVFWSHKKQTDWRFKRGWVWVWGLEHRLA